MNKLRIFSKRKFVAAFLLFCLFVIPGQVFAVTTNPNATNGGGSTTPPTNCSEYDATCASCTAGKTSAANCVDCSNTSQLSCSNVTCIDPSVKPLPDNTVYCNPKSTSCSASSCDLINKYVNPAINLLTTLVGIAVVISIIYGGIQYSSSGGDPQKAAKARGHITNTVLALVIYIFFFAFLQFLIPGGILNR